MNQTEMLCAAVDRIMNSDPKPAQFAPLYFCPHCDYVGYDYGFETRDIRNNQVIGHTCPNDCRDAAGGTFDMLEYDYEDDSVPNASAKDHDIVLAAFHEFLGKEKQVDIFYEGNKGHP